MPDEFDHPNLSPSDAVVALRSFPRRFRGLLATDDGDDPEGVAMRRPDAAGWSALEHAAHVANALDQAAADLQAAHRDEGVTVADPTQAATTGATDVDGTLSRLTAASDQLVGAIERYNPDDWKRTVRSPDGRAVNALWIVQAAVQEGARHLRQAEQVIAQVKGRPVGDDDGDD